MIQIHHNDWLNEFKAIVHPDQIFFGPAIPLETAVLALYRLTSRKSELSMGHRILMFEDLRERLLYCSIAARIEGDKRRYFELFPAACIGEEIALKTTPSSDKVSGHLCEWDTCGGDEWKCVISNRGEMVRQSLDWKQLEDESLILSGEMGKLHRDLLRKCTVWHRAS